MKALKFTKMSGNGNDFIVIDNYSGKIRLSEKQIQALCAARFSVGADGLIMLEKSRPPYDFYMRFYNNDGREAEMCGNGGRCIARFAYVKGYASAKMRFLAKDGPHEAQILPSGTVNLKMIDPAGIRTGVVVPVRGKKYTGTFLNTGVPHFVVSVKDVGQVDVEALGRAIRYHRKFAPKGTNVNFISKKNGMIHIRTYERGVESETYACGTGATAAGIASYLAGSSKPPVRLMSKGGALRVSFTHGKCAFTDVWLQGNARIVYEGVVNKEAYKY
ncbi:MAG TPA: diaminopimelate epimerase [Candidatus Goldiibacteriota bacterium]|nr:diaminopimelate epimerase [Candidatus Goldiibacteriota bacterium]